MAPNEITEVVLKVAKVSSAFFTMAHINSTYEDFSMHAQMPSWKACLRSPQTHSFPQEFV